MTSDATHAPAATTEITWEGPEALRPLLVPIDSIEALPGNPRRGDVEVVARSLERFGQMKPVTLNANGQVTAGNHTRAAALSLGWTHLAVVPTDQDEVLGAAWALADNRSSDLATYDDVDLASMLAAVQAQDASLLASAGFNDAEELAQLLAALEPPSPQLTDPDAVPEPPAEPITKPGDLWLLGRHRLLCGDASSVEDHERAMGGGMADLVLMDPPYGVGVDYGPTTDDTEETIRGLMAAVMPLVLRHPRALVTCGHRLMWDYPRPAWVLAWVHPAGNGRSAWGFTCLNPVLAYGTDPYLSIGEGSRPDTLVLATDREGETGHPVVKPMEAWRWLLRRGSAAEGETVFDPFMGSGTTIIAAEMENRRAVGIEISPTYCDIAVARWEAFTGEKATLCD